MATSPDLKVSLLAGDVEVASSTDPAVWLSTMAAITGVAAPKAPGIQSGDPEAPKGSAASDPVNGFALELEVTADQLIGAASPSFEAPFIHLDHRYWEALKQKTPARGVGAVPGVVLAATLLLLWNRHAKFGRVTGAMCDAVLATINHDEKNRARSLRRCEWIQVRDDGLRLDPAHTSSAIRLARAYVLKEAPK
jgi:hypothetical protein